MSTPKVAVLLATFQGMPWLPEQLDSILNQHDVAVRIIVSDDGSTDDTLRTLDAVDQTRITRLPQRPKTGGSAQNFLYLMANSVLDDDEYVAFADQDDVWQQGKLAHQVSILQYRRADATSSSIDARYPDGRTVYLRKNYSQCRLDFVCESAGPGATYLLSPEAFRRIRKDLTSDLIDVQAVGFHDWLVYALARAHQLTWVIDRWPTIIYRQHETNTLGANHGLAAVKARLGMLSDGWYRKQFVLMAQVCAAVCEDDNLRADLIRVQNLLTATSFIARLKLAAACWQLRRRIRDKIVLAATALIGLW